MEIEVKLKLAGVDDARARLARAGATPRGAREFEDNRLYDDAGGSLVKAKKVLRLRSIAGRHLVTYKAPDPASAESRFKIRIEHETSVGDADAFDLVLQGLGYRPLWRYQKYRQGFVLPGPDLAALHVELDETPLGVFLELEGPEAAIDDAARRLGFTSEDYVTLSYRELQERAAGTSEGVGDLVFGPGMPPPAAPAEPSP